MATNLLSHITYRLILPPYPTTYAEKSIVYKRQRGAIRATGSELEERLQKQLYRNNFVHICGHTVMYLHYMSS